MSTRRTLIPIVLLALAGLACSALSPETATPTATVTVAPTTTSADTEPTATVAVEPPTTTPTDAHTPTPSSTPPPGPEGDPLPHLTGGAAVDILRIQMNDAASGWAVGRSEGDPNDHILRTEDGGETWRDVSPPEPEGEAGAGHAAVAYFAGELAWAAYYDRDFSIAPSAYMWRTTDAGATWDYSAPLDMSDMEFFTISDLHFAGPAVGWLVAHVGVGMNHDYVILFQTGDEGATWHRAVDPFDIRENNLQMSCLKTGIGFVSVVTGWVTGDCQGVAPGFFLQRSDDGGFTWRQETLPPPPGMPNAFERQDGSCGTYQPTRIDASQPEFRLVLTCNFYEDTLVTTHFLYSILNGSETWEAHPLPASQVSWLNQHEGWAIDAADPNNPNALRLIYHTIDAGATWTEINTVAWTAGLDFIASDLGWAVAQAGDESALVKSDDGGASWQIMEPSIAP